MELNLEQLAKVNGGVMDDVVKEHTHFIPARSLDTVIGYALTADPSVAR